MAKNKIHFTKANLEKLPIPTLGKRNYFHDIKTQGLCLSVTSNGTKSFMVYRWVKGKPERITLGRYPSLSIENARRKAGITNGIIAEGNNPNDKRRAERAEITLNGLLSEYLERYAKLHKKAWQADEKQFKRYLVSWGNRKLSAITRIEIQKLHQEIGQKNGTYAANRLLALLSTMFNKAIEYSLWDKPNPVHGIKKFREQSRERFLQADELPRFFQALSREPNEAIRDYVLLSLLTGARRSNVLSMKWSSINFTLAEWRIENTKNGTPQTIPLTPEALNILEARKANQECLDYVFPSNSKLGYMVEPKRGWQRILERAEIKDLRLHDLRRTLGSWQARTGASLTIIGKSLNHKSPASTAVYARLDLDPVRNSLQKATKAILDASKLEQKESSQIY